MKIKYTHSRTVYLLRKYIKNECTKQEIKELSGLLKREKDNEEIDLVTYSLWEAVNRTINSSKDDSNELRAEATNIIRKHKRKSRTSSILTLSISAAVAAVLLLISLNLPLGMMPFSEKDSFTQTTVQQQFKTENTTKKVVLPDQSVVHLNKHTTLTLKKGKFNANTREVWLDEGEAFFEITKDTQRPFKVYTPNGLTTQVLGTSFNIQAYPSLKRQVISVKTGRVQVNRVDGEKIVLDPDYQVAFDHSANTFTAGKTDGTMAAAWREGLIVFQRAKMEEISLRLKQHFDIVLIYDQSKYSKVEYSAVFPAHTSINDIAKTLSKIYNIDYTIENQKLWLK